MKVIKLYEQLNIDQIPTDLLSRWQKAYIDKGISKDEQQANKQIIKYLHDNYPPKEGDRNQEDNSIVSWNSDLKSEIEEYIEELENSDSTENNEEDSTENSDTADNKPKENGISLFDERTAVYDLVQKKEISIKNLKNIANVGAIALLGQDSSKEGSSKIVGGTISNEEINAVKSIIAKNTEAEDTDKVKLPSNDNRYLYLIAKLLLGYIYNKLNNVYKSAILLQNAAPGLLFNWLGWYTFNGISNNSLFLSALHSYVDKNIDGIFGSPEKYNIDYDLFKRFYNTFFTIQDYSVDYFNSTPIAFDKSLYTNNYKWSEIIRVIEIDIALFNKGETVSTNEDYRINEAQDTLTPNRNYLRKIVHNIELSELSKFGDVGAKPNVDDEDEQNKLEVDKDTIKKLDTMSPEKQKEILLSLIKNLNKDQIRQLKDLINK